MAMSGTMSYGEGLDNMKTYMVKKSDGKIDWNKIDINTQFRKLSD